MTTTIALGDIPLGQPLPPTPHALCMSLPNWKHVVGCVEGEKTILDTVVTGYPRFFIHRSVQKVRSSASFRYPFSPTNWESGILADRDLRAKVWPRWGDVPDFSI
jgi:hypothetical protein